MASQDRRAAIIRTAVEMFAERGFRGTTTRELAAACGVSEPVLYQHFATKRDLYTAIIEAKLQEHCDRGCVLQTHIEAQDDRAVFTCFAENIVAWYTHDTAYIRLLLFSALEGHELTVMFHEHATVRSYRQFVVDYIRRRVEAGAFRAANPDLASRAFLGMIANYALGDVIFRCNENEDRAEVIAGMVEIFLEGMRTNS